MLIGPLTFLSLFQLLFPFFLAGGVVSHSLQLYRHERHPLTDERGQLRDGALAHHSHYVASRYANSRGDSKSAHHQKRGPHRRSHVSKRFDGSSPLLLMDPTVAWLGHMKIGGQDLKVWYDTGSFDIITNGPKYHASQSPTAHNTGTTFRMQYFDNSNSQGEIYLDTIQIGSLKADGVAIGSSQSKLDAFEEDAIAGCGPFVMGGSTFGPSYKSFPYALVQSGAIQHARFSFALSKKGYSEISFGKINRTMIDGDIEYVGLVPGQPWWAVEGQFLGRTLKMMIDSGTTYLHLNNDLFKELVGAIPGVTISRPGDNWIGVYECANPPDNITLSFGARTFHIRGDLLSAWKVGDDKCALSVMGLDHLTQDMPMVAGEILFQKAYIVFDFGATPQIGFAKRAIL
ncbi:hypothetical protein OC846_004036 [Tilletia horrida]|uniref:Peptidase A1 domain-containing protein n=1 Tax=Tilletia horrida TaxID=155126 RepID=A0AAN6GQE2_9BASI|nr:hypothetical protein OC846_004036 [Tilletia horrida]